MSFIRPFCPHKGTNQVVTPAVGSAAISIDPGDQTVRLVNSGAAICYVRIGIGAQVATTADTPVASGATVLLTKGEGENNLAHISATGTTLNVQTGNGGI